MVEIAIICLLPKEVNTYYRTLRKKLAENFGLQMNYDVPAHITLKYGFPVEDLNEIEKVVEQFFLSSPITKWFLRDFGFFNNLDKYVVFIDAIPAVDTRTTHSALLENLRKIQWVKWRQFDTSDLHYHVTLASNGITSDNFADVWSFTKQFEKPNFDVYLDNLAIFRIEKDPPFVHSLFHFPELRDR